MTATEGRDHDAAKTIDGLRLRAVLGRKVWQPPMTFGPDGWQIIRYDKTAGVITTGFQVEGAEWVHASIAHYDRTMPAYAELKLLHKAVFGDRPAYQVFAAPSEHVNIHEYALHLWGRADGRKALPDFGFLGLV
jgi:hypothetical protein